MKPIDFTFGKYIGRVGYSLNEVWNDRTNKPRKGFKELGRIEASRLPIDIDYAEVVPMDLEI